MATATPPYPRSAPEDPAVGDDVPGLETGPVVHRRSLDLEVADHGDTLVVSGRLRDLRPWQQDPERRVLHDIAIELVVDATTMVITRATSSMSTFPHVECPTVADRFRRLEGVSVTRGYSRALREIFAGVNGCAHVYELARAAGAAVTQGAMSRSAREGRREQLDIETLRRGLGGTCHIWAADGPGFAKLEAGWRPGTEEYPAPSVETVRARSRGES